MIFWGGGLRKGQRAGLEPFSLTFPFDKVGEGFFWFWSLGIVSLEFEFLEYKNEVLIFMEGSM